MQLINHGAGCCGVTHLYLSESSGPGDRYNYPAKKFDYKDLANTARGIMVMTDEALKTPYDVRIGYRQYIGYVAPAYTEDRPAETFGERGKALLTGWKKERPSGVIEVVTTNEQDYWHPWLTEQGFLPVTKAVNSNSGNLLTIWHLAYGMDPDTWTGDEDDDDYDFPYDDSSED